MKSALLFVVALAGCSSDEGTVSVRVVSRPAPATRAGTIGDTQTTAPSDVVAMQTDRVGIVANQIGAPHLLVTVSEVDVKVKKKHGHGHHHGQCNEGDEHGSMHEGDEAGNHDDADGEHDGGDDHEDGDHHGGEHKHKHHGAWRTIFSGHQTIDLFDTSAAGSFLARGSGPTGTLVAIRLVLAGDITLVDGTTSWPVQCPSCSTSGLKIKTHGVNVVEGRELVLSIDFSQSLSGDATTGYVLHPVLHLQSVTCEGHHGDHDDDGDHDDGDHDDGDHDD